MTGLRLLYLWTNNKICLFVHPAHLGQPHVGNSAANFKLDKGAYPRPSCSVPNSAPTLCLSRGHKVPEGDKPKTLVKFRKA